VMIRPPAGADAAPPGARRARPNLAPSWTVRTNCASSGTWSRSRGRS